jgi:hypothetical protein
MHEVYIGLDVHKAQMQIALAFSGRREVESYGKASTDVESFLAVLRRILKKHDLTKKRVAIYYEAGPTGFVLARRLRTLGYECEVVAPSFIPTRASDRVKTDRRDAKNLASLFRAGELIAVHVPDVEDEVIRDVGRSRTDAVEVQTRAKQQLSALLLRNGYHYKGKSTWSEPHMRYLREQIRQQPCPLDARRSRPCLPPAPENQQYPIPPPRRIEQRGTGCRLAGTTSAAQAILPIDPEGHAPKQSNSLSIHCLRVNTAHPETLNIPSGFELSLPLNIFLNESEIDEVCPVDKTSAI